MNDPIESKIVTFLDQYSLSEDAKKQLLGTIRVLLYVDLFEKMATLLPEAERNQAESYLRDANPVVATEIHQKIKDFMQKNLSEEVIQTYIDENLDKILSMIAEKAFYVSQQQEGQ